MAVTNNNSKGTYTDLNVYAKLLLARKMFLTAGVKKTGVNRHLEFKYFELEDIVPVATEIGNEIGLLFLTTFENEYALMTVVNTDNPTETIEFKSPMKEIDSIESSRTGGKLTNAVQNLGSVETYQRRYLYITALDIVEADGFDGDVGAPEAKATTKKPAPKKAAPVTPEKRKEIKNEVVDSAGQADELQIEALKNVMEQLLELDPEQESLVQQIVVETDKLTNISKEACETLITELGQLVESYTVVNGSEE
ncbi:ERF family protein [Anaerocaecibacter muris]|uniref:ERF family protein n=1 Tax=Anaerocaecibacter muris TaxID=2941513 RepID=UPI00203A7FE4|nr:ERF family protein [Anaerocaecibacter muris]